MRDFTQKLSIFVISRIIDHLSDMLEMSLETISVDAAYIIISPSLVNIL